MVDPTEELRGELSSQVGLITVHGEAKLYEGTVVGLDTAERIGNLFLWNLCIIALDWPRAIAL